MLTEAECRSIVEHMNADHREALRRYWRVHLGLPADSGDDVVMTGIDASGFELALHGDRRRYVFAEPLTGMADARRALVELARR